LKVCGGAAIKQPARSVAGLFEGERDWWNRIEGTLKSKALQHFGFGGTIRLWDPACGAETARPEGHGGSVLAPAGLPDGRLASTGEDATIRLGTPRLAPRPRA
jgi:WD40 repeat protein